MTSVNLEDESGTKSFFNSENPVYWRDFPDSWNPAFSAKKQSKRETVNLPPRNQPKSWFRNPGTVSLSLQQHTPHPPSTPPRCMGKVGKIKIHPSGENRFHYFHCAAAAAPRKTKLIKMPSKFRKYHSVCRKPNANGSESPARLLQRPPGQPCRHAHPCLVSRLPLQSTGTDYPGIGMHSPCLRRDSLIFFANKALPACPTDWLDFSLPPWHRQGPSWPGGGQRQDLGAPWCRWNRTAMGKTVLAISK